MTKEKCFRLGQVLWRACRGWFWESFLIMLPNVAMHAALCLLATQTARSIWSSCETTSSAAKWPCRLLPDVQSCPSRHGSQQGRWIGPGTEAHPRPLCLLLECPSWLQRPPLAGTVLLLPTASATPWEALRYTELNPVRAGLVADAGSWPWSSATAHLGQTSAEGFLDIEPWQHNWSATTWRAYLAAGETQSELAAIRHCTYTGRPMGTAEFIRQ